MNGRYYSLLERNNCRVQNTATGCRKDDYQLLQDELNVYNKSNELHHDVQAPGIDASDSNHYQGEEHRSTFLLVYKQMPIECRKSFVMCWNTIKVVVITIVHMCVRDDS